MNFCETCFYREERFCAVNPLHCKGAWSEACGEYQHDEKKVRKCGNCIGLFMGECTLPHIGFRDLEDKACMDFISRYSRDEDDVQEIDILNWRQFRHKFQIRLYSDNKIALKLIKPKPPKLDYDWGCADSYHDEAWFWVAKIEEPAMGPPHCYGESRSWYAEEALSLIRRVSEKTGAAATEEILKIWQERW
ncbi:hypothetical protein CAL7716_100560 (plasmid) [Calothrix sp. PCC 7716]|nr:hypothetical protein CAL7716_100560 [Calothrix sp. PCC 7716]